MIVSSRSGPRSQRGFTTGSTLSHLPWMPPQTLRLQSASLSVDRGRLRIGECLDNASMATREITPMVPLLSGALGARYLTGPTAAA